MHVLLPDFGKKLLWQAVCVTYL